MADPQLHVRNLHVRAPGDDRASGERLAAGVRDTLEAAASLAPRSLGALRLRVQVAPGASEAETLHAIQRALRDALSQE
jgi:hypothetical protein